MKPADAAELLLLAALWGASFLFMRLGAGEFGPIALAAVRVAGAALFLLPLLALRGQFGALRGAWRPIAVVGLTNSALPFVCFAYATLSITGGLASIFNAAAPLFGAAIAWVWLDDRLNRSRSAGLVIGLIGVLWLAWSNVNAQAGFKPGGSGWAIVACLLATLFYGFAANYTKRRLSGVAPLAVAAGSQSFAALFLCVPAVLWWPAVPPSLQAWSAVAALAIALLVAQEVTIDRARDEARSRGVDAGERIAVMSLNHPSTVFLFIALARLGAVMVPINPEFRAEEARYVLTHADVSGVVCSPAALSTVREALAFEREHAGALRRLPLG